MVLSEAEAETRLAALRRQREAIDRAITDVTLYLELGRRLRTEGAPAPATQPPAVAAAPDLAGDPGPTRPDAAVAGPEAAPHAPAPRPPHEVPAQEPYTREPPARERPGNDATDGVGEAVRARRYGRALIEAALGVLGEAGRPLHASEILAALAARGFAMPGQQDPVAALNTRLWKRSGPGGPVRRLGDAVYALPDGAGGR